MTPLALKHRFSIASPTFGVFSSIVSNVALEQLALAGYDYVIIDVEHTLFNPAQLDSLLLTAKASGVSTLVRIPNSRWDWIAPLLDAGATGIIAANIKTAAEAEALVAASYYYPLGQRGLNSTRFNGYATQDMATSNSEANKQVVLIAMIESREGLANANAIGSVTGIDAILEGAADLSQDLGLPWQTQHPYVKAALQDLQIICAHQGCGYIALPRQLADISQWRKRDVHHFVVGDDRSIMRRAHQQHLNDYLQEYQLGG